jgi:hypothetical protein
MSSGGNLWYLTLLYLEMHCSANSEHRLLAIDRARF